MPSPARTFWIPLLAAMIILLYHRILRNPQNNPYSPHGVVSLAEFESQIDFLRREFQLVSLEEWLRALRGKKRNTRRLVSLTFDDGWRDVWKYGVPILRARHIPVTFFLTTHFLDGGGIPWWEKLYALVTHPPAKDWTVQLQQRFRVSKESTPSPPPISAKILADPSSGGKGGEGKGGGVEETVFWTLFQRLKRISAPVRDQLLSQPFEAATQKTKSVNGRLFLNWAEARALATVPFFTIGAHGIDHECLSTLPRAAILRQECESKRILEKRLGRKVDFFAYPFGSHWDVSQAAGLGCRSVGFRAALTAEAGVNSPRTSFFQLKRIPVGLELSGKPFRAFIKHPEVFLSKTSRFRWP